LRGGHIAVGEMFLTKYLFTDKKFLYLWPRMTNKELNSLDKSKSNDKEWNLLRHEPNVEIKTLDDLIGLPTGLRNFFYDERTKALKGVLKTEWNKKSKQLHAMIKSGEVIVK
jgi:hypothetical protein